MELEAKKNYSLPHLAGYEYPPRPIAWKPNRAMFTVPPIPITSAIFRDREPVIVTLDFADNADVPSATR